MLMICYVPDFDISSSNNIMRKYRPWDEEDKCESIYTHLHDSPKGKNDILNLYITG